LDYLIGSVYVGHLCDSHHRDFVVPLLNKTRLAMPVALTAAPPHGGAIATPLKYKTPEIGGLVF
ncbi:MAG: hypothetical protein LWX70_09040, partial [Sphingobacteriia bacterium]|nr:hypothetical protein [Sphingobacteriia bacterium]